MWILFDESRSGIFLELKLLDITLLYGQGFFSFLAFGVKSTYQGAKRDVLSSSWYAHLHFVHSVSRLDTHLLNKVVVDVVALQ